MARVERLVKKKIFDPSDSFIKIWPTRLKLLTWIEFPANMSQKMHLSHKNLIAFN